MRVKWSEGRGWGGKSAATRLLSVAELAAKKNRILNQSLNHSHPAYSMRQEPKLSVRNKKAVSRSYVVKHYAALTSLLTSRGGWSRCVHMYPVRITCSNFLGCSSTLAARKRQAPDMLCQITKHTWHTIHKWHADCWLANNRQRTEQLCPIPVSPEAPSHFRLQMYKCVNRFLGLVLFHRGCSQHAHFAKYL